MSRSGGAGTISQGGLSPSVMNDARMHGGPARAAGMTTHTGTAPYSHPPSSAMQQSQRQDASSNHGGGAGGGPEGRRSQPNPSASAMRQSQRQAESSNHGGGAGGGPEGRRSQPNPSFTGTPPSQEAPQGYPTSATPYTGPDAGNRPPAPRVVNQGQDNGGPESEDFYNQETKKLLNQLQELEGEQKTKAAQAVKSASATYNTTTQIVGDVSEKVVGSTLSSFLEMIGAGKGVGELAQAICQLPRATLGLLGVIFNEKDGKDAGKGQDGKSKQDQDNSVRTQTKGADDPSQLGDSGGKGSEDVDRSDLGRLPPGTHNHSNHSGHGRGGRD